jgi:hypothetical protein
MAYQLTNGDGVLRVADNAYIPSDPSNKDYAEYLAWVDEGNVAEPVSASVTPDYWAFWDALVASTVYTAIRDQSLVSLPLNTLATEFIALLGDAKAGRPNESAIQQSVDALVGAGTFTQGQLDDLQAALESGNLDGVYTLPES